MGRVHVLAVVFCAASIGCGVAGAAGAAPKWAFVWAAGDRLHLLESGGRPRPLARGGFAPSWSPDGTEVAFLRNKGVYVVARNGTRLRRVATGSWDEVLWSPGGRSLALVRRGGVYVAGVEGTPPRRVLASTGVVSWVNDERLLCRCGGRIVAVDVDGTRLTVLATTRRDGVLGAASSSSDGTMVAFGRRCWRTPIAGQDLYCALAVARPDGSGRRTLIQYRRGDWAGANGDTRPLWIPGTHRLLVLEWNKGGFVEVDADSGARRVVRPGVGWGVVVGADGTFAYLGQTTGTTRLNLFVVDSGGRVLVRRPVPTEFDDDAAIYLG